MKVFLIEVDLRQLLKLIRPKIPNPIDAWRRYWLEHTEPADAWVID